jgi:thiol-disulfide isomerase/thioredoxin
MRLLEQFTRVCVVVLTVAVGSLPARAQDVGIPVGMVPADAAVETLDGEAAYLSRWIGDGPAVLEFWARWCEVCEALQPQLDDAYARFGDRVAFVAVAVAVNQSPRSVRRHLERHPVPYPVVWDAEGGAVRSYKAPTTGFVVILDGEGRVAYTAVGERQDVIAALERILGE